MSKQNQPAPWRIDDAYGVLYEYCHQARAYLFHAHLDYVGDRKLQEIKKQIREADRC